ncbi:hypothetical protein SAMN05421788_110235 [Filimonas lacunae]|uniref:Uncharacterized protein n=1 Tax=Filimonas lacunae TaxID=477680 RepID=A0A173MAC2_9BACT|nr:hypothetical protein [Filimonas lacunae]BAV04503.1 hypothetical protein FLA_0495 [Filimonas lacunae]SIT31608.1 hypothetical protein SAMN05421788_110235 [Filimonas lacunae]
MSVEINDITIEQLVAAYEATEESIVEDADEDPSVMLDIQDHLENLILLTAQLMEGWEPFFEELDEHETARYFIKLSPALKASQQVMLLIKKYGLNRGDIKTFYRRLKPEVKEFSSAMKKLLNTTINPDDIDEEEDEDDY